MTINFNEKQGRYNKKKQGSGHTKQLYNDLATFRSLYHLSTIVRSCFSSAYQCKYLSNINRLSTCLILLTFNSLATRLLWWIMADDSRTRNLKKLLTEILDTERTYVKNIDILAERYLRPLSTETFVTTMEIKQLSESLHEILKFQRAFLQSLESVMDKHSDVYSSDDEKIIRRAIFAVGGVFLFYAEQFKIYSSFCALYSKVQDILNTEENEPLRHFLDNQNQTGEHSQSLESFIILPIQRVLKYPLFLKQMSSLTAEDSDENQHICKACDEMQSVANHINEMQKLYAEFGDSFRCLSSQDLGVRDLYSERPSMSYAGDNIPVIKSGYCIKEGKKMKSWKRRYFVLNEYGLFYYVSQESTEPLGFIPRNEMQHVKASTVNKHNGGLYGMFELYTENRTYFIECETPAEVQPWIKAIKSLLPRTQRRTTVLNRRDSVFYTSSGSLSNFKSGYCTKQGGKRKNWLSRYFVVNQDGIQYFTSDQSIEALRVIPSADVLGVQEVSRSQFGRDNVFEIHTCCRTFYVQCESHEDLREWVSAIRRLLPHPKIQLNVGDLCTYGVVNWYNIGDIIGRKSKTCNLVTSVFVFRSGLVIICRQKKTEEEKTGCSCLDIFRSVIPIQDIVLDVSTGETKAIYQWNITQPPIDGLPQRTYRFCSSSAEEKSRFVTAIRGATRPQVKHPNTPFTENQNKNYSPKRECIVRKLRTLRSKNPRGCSEVQSD